MKKICLLLCTVLLLTAFCCPAFAKQAAYASTRQFLQALDEIDFNYECLGFDADENEVVSITITDNDIGKEYVVKCYFLPECENASFRIWNLINFDVNDFYYVLRACNTVNYDYKYTTFYVDESDFSVTVSLDLIFRDYDVGEITLEALSNMVNIVSKGYKELAQYDI